jgi:hypothetical protein
MVEPIVSSGKRMKITSVKLSSKSLEKALREVSRRGLDKFEKFAHSASANKKKTSPTPMAA